MLDRRTLTFLRQMRVPRQLPNPFAIVALAVGIATLGSAFQLMDATLLRPVPWPSADRLVEMPLNGVVPIYSRREVAELRTIPAFASLDAYSRHVFTVVRAGQPTQVDAGRATGSLFGTVGMRPAAGRLFTQADSEPGAAPVALVSWTIWRDAYGADPGIVGQRLDVVGDDGEVRAYAIVGVLPRRVGHPFAGTDIWLPVTMDPVAPDWSAKNANLNPVARLADGYSVGSAQAMVTPMIKGWVDRMPERAFSSADRRASYRAGIDASVMTMGSRLSLPGRPTVLALLAFAILVLLSSCAMVANLIVASGVRRSREFAIRYQLGATRGRVLRLIIGESAWLAALAALAGVLLMVMAASFVRTHVPVEIDANAPVIGWVTVATLVAVAAAITLMLGLAGAIPAVESLALRSLRSGRSAPSGRFVAERTLLAVSTSLTVALTAGAGLMFRTVQALSREDAGFEPAGLVSIAVSPSVTAPDRVAGLWTSLIATLDGRGDVERAGAGYSLPLTGSNSVTDIHFADHPTIPIEERQIVGFQLATPGYIETMGLRVLEGRTFDAGDRAGAQGVAVVNAAFARAFWGEGSPVGARLGSSSDDEREIVGVISDVHHRTLGTRAEPRIYYPAAQFSPRALTLVARTASSPAVISDAVRAELSVLDPYAVVTRADRYTNLVDESMQQQARLLDVLWVFSGFGLFLSGLGVYGTMHSWLAQRRREAGIRRALGATGNVIVRWVAGTATVPLVAGTGIGIALAVAGGSLLSGFLYSVSPWDPTVLIVVVTIQFAVASLALVHPAFSAASTDPNRELNRSS